MTVELYQRDGFVVHRGIVAPDEVTHIRELITPLFDRFDDYIGPRARDVGAATPQEVGVRQPEIDRVVQHNPDLLQSSLFLKLQELASEYLGHEAKYVFDHAICKKPNSKTETAWHQDQGYLGDVKLRTVNFWVPLQATGSKNGTLEYVPGSHKVGKLLGHVRQANNHTMKLEQNITGGRLCEMEIGDVTMHHPLTFHRAGPNFTDVSRYAWSLHFGCYGTWERLMPRNILPTVVQYIRKRMN